VVVPARRGGSGSAGDLTVKSPEAHKLDGRTSCLSLADGSVFIWVRKSPSRGLYIKDSYAPVVVEIYIKLLQES
jgi:hypothetical protein